MFYVRTVVVIQSAWKNFTTGTSRWENSSAFSLRTSNSWRTGLWGFIRKCNLT